VTGRVLHSSEYQRMPWKNGGGTTTEIWKAASPAGDMLWRLSIADVASDGPFSEFPGIDRWIMVIDGKGMELTVEGRGTHRLDHAFEPFAFPGDAKTDCRLIAGPISDFNLMVARSFGSGSLRVVHLAPNATRAFAENIVALHVLRGDIELMSSAVHQLSSGDSWIAGSYGDVSARAAAPAIVAVTIIDPQERSAL
jgi:environmental stress-induced protein Ves